MRLRLYRLLLLAHPRENRAAFGRDMEIAFDALCRERRGAFGGRLAVCLREAVDVVRSGLKERRRLASSTGTGRPQPSRRPHRVLRSAHVRAFFEDLYFAVRALAARPAFSIVAVATLALGIGATTLIFSVADAVLLQPLPYPRAERLAMLGGDFGRTGRLQPLTPPDFFELRDRVASFEAVAASASATFDLVGEGAPRRLAGARVSADFFRVLAVEPVLGRGFTREEEVPGNDRVAVISSEVWQTQWGGDPGVVGTTTNLNRRPYTVVGVLPAGFHPPEAIRYQPGVDVWVPLALDRDSPEVNRNASYLWALGRLRDGASFEGAGQELAALSEVLQRDYYEGENDFMFRMERLLQYTVGDVGGAVAALVGAVGLLLAIACANVANLSLAAAGERGREMAMRSALGAGNGRMVQQLLLESVLLAVAGGGLGIGLAYGGVWLLPLIDPGELPRVAEVAVDARVLLFSLAISALTGLVFGLAPALRASRADLSRALEASHGHPTSGGPDRLRSALVVLQTALALMLLVGAGLLINSFVRRSSVDPGFDPDSLMTMSVYIPPESPSGSRWAPAGEAEWEGWRTFYTELLERVAAIPGVRAAAGTTSPPIVGAELWMAIAIEGREPDPDNPDYQPDNKVSPGYFEALGTPLIRGREFTRADDEGASHAIVNRAFAEHYWSGEDALGKRFQYGIVPDPERDWLTVVGVVDNTAQAALGEGPRPEFFVPFFQNPMRAMTIVARYDGDPQAVADAMRQAVWSLDADLPVTRLEPMHATIVGSIAEPRFYTLLLAAFAVVAMTLAAVGIYGTLAYLVGRRAREVGVRLAIGARPNDVLRMVVRQGMLLTVIGIGLGIVGALFLSRFLQGFVFGIEPSDPPTYAVVTLVVAAVAFVACFVPARRAAGLDPAETLRNG